MLKHFLLALLTFSLLVFVQSCSNKKDDFNLDYNYNYYPLTTGHYVTYNVDSISYRFNNPNYLRDTVRFQLKEVVADTFYDNENELNYRLELFRRPDATAGWSIWKVWNVKQTTTTLQKNEDDIRFIKLVFPQTNGETWNGNIYVPNTTIYDIFKNWTYRYSNLHQPLSLNGFNFDSTLVVNQVDDENVIEKKLRKEIYAKNVGMIYQEWEGMKKQRVDKDWQEGPETGFRIRMTIIDHN